MRGFFSGENGSVPGWSFVHCTGTQTHTDETDQKLGQRHVPILTGNRLNQPVIHAMQQTGINPLSDNIFGRCPPIPFRN